MKLGMIRAALLATASTLAGYALGVAVTGCGGAIPPQVATGIADGAAFAVCVLGQYSQCESAGTAAAQCTVQIVQACGGDAAAVAQVIDAHRGAEVREGYVLRPQADN